MTAPVWDRNPDVVEYLPLLDKQMHTLSRPDHIRQLFVGGVGYGKTKILGNFALRESCNYPNNLGLVAGATRPSMKLATIDKVVEEITAREVWVNHIEYRDEVHFHNSSWFKFQSLDVNKKDELEGSELGWLVIDEITGCDEDKVNALLNRVRRMSPCAKKLRMAEKFGLSTEGLTKPGDPDWWDYSRRVLLCGNPPAPGHWLEQAFVRREGQEDLPPLGEVVQCSTYENVLLPDDYIANLERQYPPGTFLHKRMMLGMFGIAAEGAIYDLYNPSVHLIDERDVPFDKAIGNIGAIDLGSGGHTGDPFVYLQSVVTAPGAPNRRPAIYFVGEYYSREGRTMEQHAHTIRALHRPGAIYCDYGGQERLELKALGIRTVSAHKDIVAGIHAVRSRFANNEIFIVRGRCPNLLRELPMYVWAEGDKTKAPEGDHALDTMRYVVSALDLPRAK